MESSHIHSDCVCTNSKWVLHGRCWGQHVLCLLALVQRQFSSRGLRLLRKHGTSVCSRYSYNLPCLCSSLIYETRKSELPIKKNIPLRNRIYGISIPVWSVYCLVWILCSYEGCSSQYRYPCLVGNCNNGSGCKIDLQE